MAPFQQGDREQVVGDQNSYERGEGQQSQGTLGGERSAGGADSNNGGVVSREVQDMIDANRVRAQAEIDAMIEQERTRAETEVQNSVVKERERAESEVQNMINQEKNRVYTSSRDSNIVSSDRDVAKPESGTYSADWENKVHDAVRDQSQRTQDRVRDIVRTERQKTDDDVVKVIQEEEQKARDEIRDLIAKSRELETKNHEAESARRDDADVHKQGQENDAGVLKHTHINSVDIYEKPGEKHTHIDSIDIHEKNHNGCQPLVVDMSPVICDPIRIEQQVKAPEAAAVAKIEADSAESESKAEEAVRAEAAREEAQAAERAREDAAEAEVWIVCMCAFLCIVCVYIYIYIYIHTYIHITSG